MPKTFIYPQTAVVIPPQDAAVADILGWLPDQQHQRRKVRPPQQPDQGWCPQPVPDPPAAPEIGWLPDITQPRRKPQRGVVVEGWCPQPVAAPPATPDFGWLPDIMQPRRRLQRGIVAQVWCPPDHTVTQTPAGSCVSFVSQSLTVSYIDDQSMSVSTFDSTEMCPC